MFIRGPPYNAYPGIPENFLKFEGNRLTGKSLPSFLGIPENFQDSRGGF